MRIAIGDCLEYYSGPEISWLGDKRTEKSLKFINPKVRTNTCNTLQGSLQFNARDWIVVCLLPMLLIGGRVAEAVVADDDDGKVLAVDGCCVV